jgi:hypothetical protein
MGTGFRRHLCVDAVFCISSQGDPADVERLINRETGDKHMFSGEDLARLSLAPVTPGLGSNLAA